MVWRRITTLRGTQRQRHQKRKRSHTVPLFASIIVVVFLVSSIMIPVSTSTSITRMSLLNNTLYTTGMSQDTIPTNSQKNSLYTYHTNYPGSTGDYSGLVSDMENLNSTYPTIFELYTAQDAFGLPNVTYGLEVYKTWIIRITNESLGFNKPEVLFIGGHHGDEKTSVEAAYYLAELLTERYENDSYIRFLVDHREIYIMPVVNPYGWVVHQRYDEHGIDMNRDYPYDPSYHIFETIGARAVHELTKNHLFINTVSWHAGTEMICYAWGCYAHWDNTESPDDVAFLKQGLYSSEYAGPYSGYYIYGRANDILYPCFGAYEDYAYAASWDTINADPAWPTNGCRSLTHCVEISNNKYPSQSTLGGRADIYTPGGDEDGFVPKNIRLALLITDIAEPYINSTDTVPPQVEPGENISFNWKVMGALNTTETNIQYGSDPDPINNYTYATRTLSGGTGWQNIAYGQNITMPTTPGDYYFVIRAKVDHDTIIQNNPDPDVAPQSLYVNMRTNSSWTITNNGNSLEGKTDWYSQTFHIQVVPSLTPPYISNILATPTLQETGGVVNISSTVTSPDGVNSVKTNVHYPDSSNVNATMTQQSGTDSYYYTTTYPLSGTYDFTIWASDAVGNTTTSDSHTFTVGIPPEISNVVATPMVQDQDGWVNLSCTVTDNMMVSTVYVDITYPDTTVQNVSMSKVSGTDVYYCNTSYTLNGSYSFYIYTTDNYGNSNISAVHYFYIGVVIANIPFTTGWNLITIPLGNTYFASTLSENITGCEVISRWDGENQTYRSYITGGPPGLDFEIKDGYGYFILVNESSTLTISGDPIMSVSVPLYDAGDTGWNLIGWCHAAPTTASSLGENITGCEVVSKWDPVEQTYRSYIVDGPPGLDYVITWDMGLFILVNETSIWNGEG